MSNTSRSIKAPSEDEKKKKFNFHEKKENLICSLNQVEYFLCHFKKIAKSIQLYKLLK